MNSSPIKNASLNWNDNGTPVSREFDDVYFSNDNGLEETRYVFLTGNQLPQRFYQHPKRWFTIAETGFGTGLNFLTVWQSFRRFRENNPQAALKTLHFVSFEKYPLRLDDLIAAHRSWPELANLAQRLQQQWPFASPGCHRLEFDNGDIILDLWLGDVNQTLPALEDEFSGRIDCWFLDGFAPAKNPHMWNDSLFSHMFRLADDGATFATFTAAGFVRRGLQQAGFDVQKMKGFGHKREMLSGVKLLPPQRDAPATPDMNNAADIAIVGGGIASAFTALALIKRGANVTLYCADDGPAQGASGNRQGALYPLLNNDSDTLSPFFTHAFTFARRRYDTLIKQGLSFSHNWCGVVQLGYDEKSRRKIDKLSLQAYPNELVYAADDQALNELCGLPVYLPGVVYPHGGWLCPAELTLQVITLAQSLGVTVRYGHTLNRLEQEKPGWRLIFSDLRSAQHGAVILANGHRITEFSHTTDLPLYAVRGQVSHIPTTPTLRRLKSVLCYDGYLTPIGALGASHCLGASHVRGDLSRTFRIEEQRQNLARLANSLPLADWVNEIDISENQARCSIRSGARDHMPMVGSVPDYSANSATPPRDRPVWENLYMIGALGARGLCSAPLLAEILACQLFKQPPPVSSQLLKALYPGRLRTDKRRGY